MTRQEHSCGVIPVWHAQRGWQFLLVQHFSGHWGWPKGHVEPGETELETARREMGEEVGISTVDILPKPKYVDRYQFTFRGQHIDKQVTLFIGRVKSRHIKRQHAELIDAHWFDYRTAKSVLGSLSTAKTLERAHQFLLTHNPWN